MGGREKGGGDSKTERVILFVFGSPARPVRPRSGLQNQAHSGTATPKKTCTAIHNCLLKRLF